MGAQRGGDSTYWTCLLRALASEHSGITFGAFTHGPANPELRAIPGLEIIEVPSRSGRWWSMVSFPLAARKWGADVIHTQYSRSPLVGRAGVTTIHDVSFFIGPEWFPARHRLILQKSVPAAARRAARILTVSETSKREIEQAIPAARGKVVATPLAAPPWIIELSPAEVEQRLAPLALPETFALSVSTLWPRKNMSLAIQAVDAMAQPIPLLLSGKEAWGELPRSPNVRMLGYVSDEVLVALYHRAAVYLCPSHHEGFGVPMVEAFRCGCPVVSSSGGALPEVSGGAALILDSKDPSVWAGELDRLLADPLRRDQMRQNGKVRAGMFSWTATAARTVEAYEAVRA